VSHHFQASTLTELHDKLCMSLVTAAKDELDVISTVDVQIHNVIAQADSMDWDFDMKEMWLTKSRWSMMLNQYLDPEELTAWVERCTSKIGLRGRGIAVMRTKTVAARGGEATGHTNKETRRWGSCMLAVSYKAVPRPQITLYSRTSYLGYIGALDLTVAWMLGKTLAKDMGIDVKDIQFVWMNEAIQWHNFKSLAFLLNHPSKKRRKKYRRLMMTKAKKLDNKEQDELEYSPALRLSRKWLAKVIQDDKDGRTYGDMTYNTFRRIVRRYHTEVHGLEYAQQFEGWSRYKTGPKEGKKKEFFKAYNPLPSTHVDTLSFDKLVPPEKLAGAEFTGEGMEDEDDE
jgi:hypothetical protein